MAMSTEQKALNTSVSLVFVSALFAAAMALYTGSMAIAADAAFSFLSAALSALGALTVHFIQKGSTKKHPMGFYSYEVLVTLIRSLFLAGMLWILFFNAVNSILAGGRDLPLGPLFLYILLSGSLSLIACLYVGKAYRKEPSLTLEIELNELKVDLFITVVIFCALTVALIIKATPYAFLVRYIDPALVVVLCFFLIKDPLLLMKDAFKHITLQSADPAFYKKYKEGLAEALASDYSFFELGELSVVPMGRMVWIYIEILPKEKNIPLEQFRIFDTFTSDLARKLFKNADAFVYFGENASS